LELPYPPVGFDKLIGAEFTEASGDRVVMTCALTPDLQQPYGLVHGGVHCSLVESAASIGGALWFGDRGNVVGVANHTNFLRAARKGRLTATAEPIQRGRTQQLWRVTITDDDGRNVAIGEVRLANITNPEVLGGS
jgi:1,4-dihydroxy-2-naphthoyl-CoA hydrolase